MTTEINEKISELSKQHEAMLVMMKIVEPFNDKQKAFYKQMKIKVHKVFVTVKESTGIIERETKKEVTMAKEHEENRALVKLIAEMN